MLLLLLWKCVREGVIDRNEFNQQLGRIVFNVVGKGKQT